MSADKKRNAGKVSSLIARIANHPFMVSGKLKRDMQRAIDLGLVKTSRAGAWSPWGPHIKRTYLILTPTGRTMAKLLASVPDRPPLPPHKREPRAEKARPKASDRRRTQPED